MTTRQLRSEAQKRIRALPPHRLKVAIDFLGYLGERADNAATRELLRIPGFKRTLKQAEKDLASGRSKQWRKVRADV